MLSYVRESVWFVNVEKFVGMMLKNVVEENSPTLFDDVVDAKVELIKFVGRWV